MKEALKRAAQALGLASAPVQAETDNDVAQAAVETTEAATVDFEAALTELQGKFEAQATQLAELTAAFADKETALATAQAEASEMEAALTKVTDELVALHEANAKAAAEALAAKLDARHKSLVTTLGTERADAVMLATKDMPDAQFATVMAAMTASTAAEAKGELFVEKGVDAQADVDALQAEAASNGTAAILKAKYQQKAAE